jgi:hypothetical protein
VSRVISSAGRSLDPIAARSLASVFASTVAEAATLAAGAPARGALGGEAAPPPDQANDERRATPASDPGERSQRIAPT